MKKRVGIYFIIVILVIGLVLTFILMKNNSKNLLKKDNKDYTLKIVDESENCSSNIEEFYEDELYTYYFPCSKSNNVYVLINNHEKYLLKDLLNDNPTSYDIDIEKVKSALDANKIEYLKKEKYQFIPLELNVSQNEIPNIQVDIENNAIVDYKLDKENEDLSSNKYNIKLFLIPHKNGNTSMQIKFTDNAQNLIAKYTYKITVLNDKEVSYLETEIENSQVNSILLGLYKNYHNGQNRDLIKEYTNEWTYHKDIASFETFYTNETNISGKNQKQLIQEYMDKYSNSDEYKLGYHLNFIADNKLIDKDIISPKDTEEFYNYLEIYLYDDYHRNGGWYSHTTEEEFNANTLLTSIKLTAGKDIEKISSDITVSVFMYQKNSSNVSYLGNNKYTLIVKKK